MSSSLRVAEWGIEGNPMKKLVYMVICGILILSNSLEHASGAEPVKSPFLVRFGTIEVNPDATRRYVFRSEGAEEVFDVSLKTFMGSSGFRMIGLPDLKEIGFKTTSGKVFKYGDTPPDVFLRDFLAKHPKETLDAMLFDGYLDGVLELKLNESTPVCRVDIKESSGHTVLWKNMPQKVRGDQAAEKK